MSQFAMIAPEDVFKLLFAVLLGSIIGIERETHSKAAGLRTITLITIGATLFTILSLDFKDDRVMANIVTGVGFLGAGAILFSDGRVKGLTTASSIWTAAALGMAVGLGAYGFAVVGTVLAFLILLFFERIDKFIHLLGYEVRSYEVTFRPGQHKLYDIELRIKSCGLLILSRRRMKLDENLFYVLWEIRGSRPNLSKFSDLMLDDVDVVSLKY